MPRPVSGCRRPMNCAPLPQAASNGGDADKRMKNILKFPSASLHHSRVVSPHTAGVFAPFEDAVRINYNITLPKTLGASDWSVDVLSPEQLVRAALDAVLCRVLWITSRRTYLTSSITVPGACRCCIPAIARMELDGISVDVAAHRAQIAQWKSDLAEAEAALHAASPLRDLQRPSDLQRLLQEVLDDDALDLWPRTTTAGFRPPSATAAQRSALGMADSCACARWRSSSVPLVRTCSKRSAE